MKRSALFSALSVLLIGPIAQALPTELYWDNTQGLVSAEKCTLGSTREIPFAVSENSSDPAKTSNENLRTFNGAIKHYLLNRSLVRFSENPNKTNYKFVDVIGVSETKGAKPNKWFADRMDDGYLYESSIKKLEDFVFELKSGTPAKTIAGVPAVGTFWHVATDGNKALSYICDLEGENVEHIMFNVHVANQVQPIARVGVQYDQTSIFKSILTHTADEAEKVLDLQMANQAAAGTDQAATNSTAAGSTAVTIVSNTSPGASVMMDSQTAGGNNGMSSTTGTTANTSLSVSGSVNSSKEVQATVGISIPLPAPLSQRPPETTSTTANSAISSSMEYIVCVNDDTLAVRNEELDTVLFRADRNESLLPMQSWDGNDVKKKTIDGKEYTFVKVQFPERDEKENVGWLAQEYVRLEGQCPQPEKQETIVSLTGPIKSITSDNCCTFPTIKRPTHNYTTGMRRFKAGRKKGRLHAANDLYRTHGEAARSIADGIVSLGLYDFYQGTFALEMKYPGGFIARFGELTGKRINGVRTGAKVQRGATVGNIGTVNSGCCLPMLHFELYSGTKSGSLSTDKKPYQRRSDLMDPTPYVRKWEKLTFGTSW